MNNRRNVLTSVTKKYDFETLERTSHGCRNNNVVTADNIRRFFAIVVIVYRESSSSASYRCVLRDPGFLNHVTIMWGAENRTVMVAIMVNKVKMIRHILSITIAANFQSFVIFVFSSASFNWSVIICGKTEKRYSIDLCLFSFKKTNFFFFFFFLHRSLFETEQRSERATAAG